MTDESCGCSARLSNVHYVDSYGSNFLIRGDSPLCDCDPKGNSCCFDYEGLKKALANAEQAPTNLPATYYISDVCLLQFDNQNEIGEIKTEWQYFLNNPAQGEFHHWQTAGTACCALDQRFSDVNYMSFALDSLDQWLENLPTRVDTLRQWLETAVPPAGIDGVVIYWHCSGRKDSTGEMIGAYYVRYME